MASSSLSIHIHDLENFQYLSQFLFVSTPLEWVKEKYKIIKTILVK